MNKHSDFQTIGGRPIRPDAIDKVTGRATFGDDVTRAASDGFPDELWSELAELGVLATGTPEGDGGPKEIAAVMAACVDPAKTTPMPTSA